jgi:hypothetical protein
VCVNRVHWICTFVLPEVVVCKATPACVAACARHRHVGIVPAVWGANLPRCDSSGTTASPSRHRRCGTGDIGSRSGGVCHRVGDCTRGDSACNSSIPFSLWPKPYQSVGFLRSRDRGTRSACSTRVSQTSHVTGHCDLACASNRPYSAFVYP